MKKNKTGLIVIGLVLICTVLTGGLYMLSQSPKTVDLPQESNNAVEDVTPKEIVDVTSGMNIPEIELTETPTDEVIPTENDIKLTEITEETKKPDTAIDTEKPHEVQTEEQIPPEKKEGTKPEELVITTPNGGDTNSKGEIYIDGFGWVKNEGGGGEGEKSQLDPEHTDFDKIIGY